LLYLGVGVLSYQYLTPSLESCKHFQLGWITVLFLRNQFLLWVFNGGWHFLFYQKRIYGQNKKYDPEWPSSGRKWLFGDQTYENVFWSCTSGVIFWTFYEVLFMYGWANGKIPVYLNWWDHPIRSIVILFLIPLWREFHFYWVHRMIHCKFLYQHVHSLHHKNVNPGPWSGLCMHPVEHLLYYTCVIIHYFVLSHPIHVFLNSQHAALTPAFGHLGFDGPWWNGRIPGGDFFHYLHHRFFECNYGESTIPLDKFFGTYREGMETPKGKAPWFKRWLPVVNLCGGSLLGILPLIVFVNATFT